MPRVYFENALGRIVEHPGGYALLRWLIFLDSCMLNNTGLE
jgi:hypothetical protein